MTSTTSSSGSEGPSERCYGIRDIISAWTAVPPRLYEDLSLRSVASSADMATAAAQQVLSTTAVKWAPLFTFLQSNESQLYTEVVTRNAVDYVDLFLRSGPSEPGRRFDVYIILSDNGDDDGTWSFRVPTSTDFLPLPDDLFKNIPSGAEVALVRFWLTPACPAFPQPYLCVDAMARPRPAHKLRFQVFARLCGSPTAPPPTVASTTAQTDNPSPPDDGTSVPCVHPKPNWGGYSECRRCHVVTCEMCDAPWPTGRAWDPPLESGGPVAYHPCPGIGRCVPAVADSGRRTTALLNAVDERQVSATASAADTAPPVTVATPLPDETPTVAASDPVPDGPVTSTVPIDVDSSELVIHSVDGCPGSDRVEDVAPDESFGPLTGPPSIPLVTPTQDFIAASAAVMSFVCPQKLVDEAAGLANTIIATQWTRDDPNDDASVSAAVPQTFSNDFHKTHAASLFDALPGAAERWWENLALAEARILRWSRASRSCVHNDRRRSAFSRDRHLTLRVSLRSAQGYSSVHCAVDEGGLEVEDIMRPGSGVAFWNVIGSVPFWGDSRSACHRDACRGPCVLSGDGTDASRLERGVAYELHLWFERLSGSGRGVSARITPSPGRSRTESIALWPGLNGAIKPELRECLRTIMPSLPTPLPTTVLTFVSWILRYHESLACPGRFVVVDWIISPGPRPKSPVPRCVIVFDTALRRVFFPGQAPLMAGDACITVDASEIQIGRKLEPASKVMRVPKKAPPTAKATPRPRPPRSVSDSPPSKRPSLPKPASGSTPFHRRLPAVSSDYAFTPMDSWSPPGGNAAELESLRAKASRLEVAAAKAEMEAKAARDALQDHGMMHERLRKAEADAAAAAAEARGSAKALEEFKNGIATERQQQIVVEEQRRSSANHDLRVRLVEKVATEDVVTLFNAVRQ